MFTRGTNTCINDLFKHERENNFDSVASVESKFYLFPLTNGYERRQGNVWQGNILCQSYRLISTVNYIEEQGNDLIRLHACAGISGFRCFEYGISSIFPNCASLLLLM